MAMAEGTGGGLIGKIDKIDFSPSDFFNETSSATSSSSSGSNTITIGGIWPLVNRWGWVV